MTTENPNKEEELEKTRQNDINRMRGNGKSVPGYISRYRRVNLIWLLVWVLLGIGIFLTGWFIWHTRANILTVLAVLMVLPGAKRIVSLIVAGKKKSVSTDRCHAVEEVAGEYTYAGNLDVSEPDIDPEDENATPYEEPVIDENVIFTDYIFTSSEKIMMADFIVVKKNEIIIYPSPSNADMEYVKGYLTKGIGKWTTAMKTTFVWDDEKLIKAVKNDSTDSVSPRERREVLAYLKSLAV